MTGLTKWERRYLGAVNLWYELRNPVTRIGDERRTEAADYISLAYSQGFIDLENREWRTEVILSATHEHHLFWALDDLPTGLTPPPELMKATEKAPPETQKRIITYNVISTAAGILLCFIFIAVMVILAINPQ